MRWIAWIALGVALGAIALAVDDRRESPGYPNPSFGTLFTYGALAAALAHHFGLTGWELVGLAFFGGWAINLIDTWSRGARKPTR